MSTRPPSLIFRGSANSTLRNVYVPGSGVGARSIAVRRALSRRASTSTTSSSSSSSSSSNPDPDPEPEPEPGPIVITQDNNQLNLIVGGFDSGSDGNIEDNILIYANTYNVTTFTDALNASISTRFSTEFTDPNPPTISYSTTTNKFTFTITGTLRIRIKDCTMKTILGFDTFDEVYDSFPIPPSSTSFESQFKVYYE